MIERIARALCLDEHPELNAGWRDIAWPDYRESARAVLQAIRDELRMTAAVNGEADPAWQDGFAHALSRIDAALAEREAG